jgi:hypothetical protein
MLNQVQHDETPEFCYIKAITGAKADNQKNDIVNL